MNPSDHAIRHPISATRPNYEEFRLDRPKFKPPLLCRLVGHNWEGFNQTRYQYPDGWRTHDETPQMFACRRCGVLNPNYGKSAILPDRA